mmetsp:Transcript_27769/g.82882  ORF Transcript_27769/g.82882 Transcript_27769/m.82882 type:complete len:222 (-) Transcript_27769:938-1603(-)
MTQCPEMLQLWSVPPASPPAAARRFRLRCSSVMYVPSTRGTSGALARLRPKSSGFVRFVGSVSARSSFSAKMVLHFFTEKSCEIPSELSRQIEMVRSTSSATGAGCSAGWPMQRNSARPLSLSESGRDWKCPPASLLTIRTSAKDPPVAPATASLSSRRLAVSRSDTQTSCPELPCVTFTSTGTGGPRVIPDTIRFPSHCSKTFPAFSGSLTSRSPSHSWT